jgi:hypothetical protein
VERNQWNDGDADDPDETHNLNRPQLPPAPLPAHERTWRHPSEMGATTVQLSAPPQPSLSRKATVATVAVGVLLVAGAVRLMTPGTGAGPVAEGGTTLTFAATSVLAGATSLAASTDGPKVSDPSGGQRAPLTVGSTLRVTTTVVEHITTGRVTPESVDLSHIGTLGDDTAAYALVLDTGRYLATTAAALGGLDSVDVHLPSGEIAPAKVVSTDGAIALLDLGGASATSAPHGTTPEPGSTVTVGGPDGGALAVVGTTNEAGYPELTSGQPLHESGPVYDGDQVLIGLCTHDDVGRAWMLPVATLDEMAAAQPQDETPTPVTASTAPVSSVSSTSTTSTSTTSTTVAATTTAAPTTSTVVPSTTVPRTAAPTTSPVTATPTTVG